VQTPAPYSFSAKQVQGRDYPNSLLTNASSKSYSLIHIPFSSWLAFASIFDTGVLGKQIGSGKADLKGTLNVEIGRNR
jgi:hypothetical protein